MSINANTSVLEYERLTAERTFLRLERKRINRERYLRRYARIGGRPKLIRVSDIVTITIGPLTAVTWPIDVLGLVGTPPQPLHAYGPIGSDNLT
jgi:hypothetical protein